MKRKMLVLWTAVFILLFTMIAYIVTTRMYNLKNDPLSEDGAMWRTEDGRMCFFVDEGGCSQGEFISNGIEMEFVIFTSVSEEAWIDYYITDADGSHIMFTEVGSFTAHNRDEFTFDIGSVSFYSHEDGKWIKTLKVDNEKVKFYRVSE